MLVSPRVYAAIYKGDLSSSVLTPFFRRFVVTFFILTYFLNRPCICAYMPVHYEVVDTANIHQRLLCAPFDPIRLVLLVERPVPF